MGEIYAFMSAIGFALANVMIKKGTTKNSKNNGAFLSVILTTLIAGIFFIGLGLSRGWAVLNLEGILFFMLAGIFTAFLGRNLLYSSIQHLGAVRSTAVKRLNPFFAVILAILILNETMTFTLFIGMILIFFSFGILIHESYRSKQAKEQDIYELGDSNAIETSLGIIKKTIILLRQFVSIGYFFGLVSAFCYSLGYVARKYGLKEIPDSFFGALLGSGVGAVCFVLMALFQERYRIIVSSTFKQFQPWLFTAGIMTSLGQILYFLALYHIEVSRVALIASIEIIFTIFLSAWVFKTFENLNITVITASIISMLGAAIITLGQ
jgi:drug/metabolite transporter (DMT)-like permease